MKESDRLTNLLKKHEELIAKLTKDVSSYLKMEQKKKQSIESFETYEEAEQFIPETSSEARVLGHCYFR